MAISMRLYAKPSSGKLVVKTELARIPADCAHLRTAGDCYGTFPVAVGDVHWRKGSGTDLLRGRCLLRLNSSSVH